jgi:putative cardiolipin synthase
MALARDLRDVIAEATKEVMFISPYYVPRKNGVEFVRELVKSNIKVIVITNSLASNNHVPVHSAYSRYRKDVVRAGVELFETRAEERM